MDLEFGLTSGPFNTKYAPLASFAVHFQRLGLLEPLHALHSEGGRPDFSLADKLTQVLISLLAGCEYISEVNTRLRAESLLAQVWGFPRFLEQSSLALCLNELDRMNLWQLRHAVQTMWAQTSRAKQHDWRGLLWLDSDLSGLPCGKGAEGSQKGYFSGKKRPLAVSLLAPAPERRAKAWFPISCLAPVRVRPVSCRWWPPSSFYSI